MSRKVNKNLTLKEIEIEKINSDGLGRNHIHFQNVFRLEEYMIKKFYEARQELSFINNHIRSLKGHISDLISGDCSVPETIYKQLELETFRKQKLVKDTRKLFDQLSDDDFFLYLNEIYENTKTAAGTGTMSGFFEKLENGGRTNELS